MNECAHDAHLYPRNFWHYLQRIPTEILHRCAYTAKKYWKWIIMKIGSHERTNFSIVLTWSLIAEYSSCPAVSKISKRHVSPSAKEQSWSHKLEFCCWGESYIRWITLVIEVRIAQFRLIYSQSIMRVLIENVCCSSHWSLVYLLFLLHPLHSRHSAQHTMPLSHLFASLS